MKSFFLFAIPFLAASCSTPKPQENAAIVQSVMKRLYGDLRTLTPYLFSSQRFNDPANEPTLREKIVSLSKNADLADHHKIFDGNPAAQVNIRVLSEHLISARQSFLRGNKPYSRYMLRGAVEMCITCHTSGFDSKAFFPQEDKDVMASIDTTLGKAEYYLTTRQFPLAKTTLREAAAEAVKTKKPMELEESYRYLAVLYATVLRDPKEAAQTFRQERRRKGLPPELKKTLGLWIKGFDAWAADRKPLPADPEQALAIAQKLINWTPNQNLISYKEELFVPKLRAAVIASKLLTSSQDAAVKARATHLLGLVYNGMNSRASMELDDPYFQICIDLVPHTARAESCYRSLEESLTLKSTGSSGVHLEEEDRVLLQTYKEKAAVQ